LCIKYGAQSALFLTFLNLFPLNDEFPDSGIKWVSENGLDIPQLDNGKKKPSFRVPLSQTIWGGA